MKILMIGGTGNISGAVSERLIEQGHDLYLINKGKNPRFTMENVTNLIGDINDEAGTAKLIEDHTFDVVVNWVAFVPEQAQRDIRLFKGKTKQYIYISSASAYQKPTMHYLITEETPLENPYWQYSREKAACEKVFMEAYKSEGFPATVVRPSLTYGDTVIPYVMGNWGKPYSLIDRMRKGKRVIVPGDGTSLWEITHNSDFAKGFVGLMGNEKAIGEAFHITSGEVLTWDIVVEQMAEVLGVEPKMAHISSEFIMAFMPEQLGNLLGDKVVSVVFDNSKLKSLVPDFKATTTFKEGIAKTIAYYDAHPELQAVGEDFEDELDRIIAAHDYGMIMANK